VLKRPSKQGSEEKIMLVVNYPAAAANLVRSGAIYPGRFNRPEQEALINFVEAEPHFVEE